MKTSEKGLAFIRQVEGVKYKAYLDTGGVWTNGVGHTGPDVYKGQIVGEDQVKAWLVEDVVDAENSIEAYVKVPLTQNQFDALVSFVFNIGDVAFKRSTMLRMLNVKDYTGAANQFDRWVFDNGKKINGLVKRRKLEKELFLSA